jgi:hypothetical protein
LPTPGSAEHGEQLTRPISHPMVGRRRATADTRAGGQPSGAQALSATHTSGATATKRNASNRGALALDRHGATGSASTA